MESQASLTPMHIYSVEWAKEEELTNCTPIYRNPHSPQTLMANFKNPVSSIFQAFERSCDLDPQKDCIGVQVPGEDGKPVYKWTSYADWRELILKTAKVLEKFNIVGGDNKFVVMAATLNKEWLLLDMALMRVCAISVPFYRSLGPKAVKQIFHETQAQTLAGISEDLLKYIQDEAPESVKHLVCLDTPSTELLAKSEKYVLADLQKELADDTLNEQTIKSPRPDLETVFFLSYTSGTTGDAKGALIRHKNLLPIINFAGSFYDEDKSLRNVALMFLPMAHIMGRMNLYISYYHRSSQGLFGGDITKLMDDIQLLKPTHLVGIPRLLNKTYDGIHFKMQQEGPEEYAFFKKALGEKIANLRKDGTVIHPQYDPLLFDKLKQVLGGELRIIVTGSAPISRDVLQFLRVVFCCSVVEAYGQTESTGAGFSTPIVQNTTGHLGSVWSCNEFKLEDVQDLNYFHTDKPYPRGEVCLRGDNVISGYYKNPEKTKQAIDERGWLHTGDIGMLIEGNALKLIDRKKNIFKLSQGEYIAPEKIENVLQTCSLIQSAFVHGDSLRDHIVAIIVPDQDVVTAVSKKLELKGSYEEICQSSELRGLLREQMDKMSDSGKLNSLERVKNHFIVSPAPFTPDDVLTSTMKLKRKVAREHFKEEIEKLYSK